MALHPYIAAQRQARLEKTLSSPTFLVVAGSLPGLAVATTLEQGFAMGVVSAVSILVMALAMPLINRLTNWVARIPVALMVSAAVVCLLQMAVYIIDPAVEDALGMYVPLAATNALAMTFVAKNDLVVKPAKGSVATGVLAALAVVVTLAFTGLVNGVLSSGEIFGLTMTELAETPVAIFGKPAGSLLVLTLVAVFVQSLEGGLFKAPAASDGGDK